MNMSKIRCGSLATLFFVRQSCGVVHYTVRLPHEIQKFVDADRCTAAARLMRHRLKECSLANICPLFKKGDRSLACNYRPVSLTCVPCKLLEHIVCSNIMAHLDEHKLLSEKQHAFRKWLSCETQLITVIDDWAKILDNQGQIDTFILDFEKAFDTPPHELLKTKLFTYIYGIGGRKKKSIDAFLCFRQHRVVVNGVKSDWAPVVSGVPQGTVLGPLLFSLHINDIMSDIESEIRLFADDCVCYREI